MVLRLVIEAQNTDALQDLFEWLMPFLEAADISSSSSGSWSEDIGGATVDLTVDSGKALTSDESESSESVDE